jgi:hypothetical protein
MWEKVPYDVIKSDIIMYFLSPFQKNFFNLGAILESTSVEICGFAGEN